MFIEKKKTVFQEHVFSFYLLSSSWLREKNWAFIGPWLSIRFEMSLPERLVRQAQGFRETASGKVTYFFNLQK